MNAHLRRELRKSKQREQNRHEMAWSIQINHLCQDQWAEMGEMPPEEQAQNRVRISLRTDSQEVQFYSSGNEESIAEV